MVSPVPECGRAAGLQRTLFERDDSSQALQDIRSRGDLAVGDLAVAEREIVEQRRALRVPFVGMAESVRERRALPAEPFSGPCAIVSSKTRTVSFPLSGFVCCRTYAVEPASLPS